MNKLFSGISLFILCILFGSFTNVKAYKIKVEISGLQDTTIILGHYLNKSMYPDDTLWLDKSGKGTFQNFKKLPEGLYVIYLPTSSYFQFIIGEDQEFEITADTSGQVQNIKFKGTLENQIFSDFQLLMMNLSKEAQGIQEQLKTATDEKTKTALREQMKDINDKRLNYINKVNLENPDLFVSTFLKATVDIIVPDPPNDENGGIDSTWQYYYYRYHYFDNFDISDPRLLRTPLYEDKLMNYITKVIPQIPDSIIPEVDKLMDISQSDSSLFRYMLITLFNHFGKSQIMGMDAVQIHIAEKYYVAKAWWSDPKFIEDLKERIKVNKPLLLGQIAPDIQLVQVPDEHFIAAANDTALKRNPYVGNFINLYNLKNRYTVLLFWEADCGHCKTAVPKMHELYNSELKKLDVEVLAISTLFGEEGKIEWIDFVNKHKLYDWINAWNPYDYKFKIIYDVNTTPTIYVLDENKGIVAKRINPEQVVDLIKVLIQEKK
ncbi:MAG: redoxin domain-containing protein [Bacteroidales bacterium]|nr:redoxin domain-containing protein [Bacteroidales bacterium]